MTETYRSGPSRPGGILVASVLLLAVSLVLSLVVRAVADGWDVVDVLARLVLPALVGVGVAVYLSRPSGRTWLFLGLAAGPVMVPIGVAIGFVLDAPSIWILLAVVLVLFGLLIVAPVAQRRRDEQPGTAP